jgi:hypothetical protein
MSVTAPETPEGASPLPNEEVTIPNYSMLNVKQVVVHGIRTWNEDEKHYKYRPTVAYFMNTPDQPPIMINTHLQQQFDDGAVMARMTVLWVNQMFDIVSKKVSIFDAETTELLVKYDVMELIQLEAAEDEYRELQFTNKYKIH